MREEQILRKYGITDPDRMEELMGLADWIADNVYSWMEYYVNEEERKGEISDGEAEAVYELVKYYLRQKLD